MPEFKVEVHFVAADDAHANHLQGVIDWTLHNEPGMRGAKQEVTNAQRTVAERRDA